MSGGNPLALWTLAGEAAAVLAVLAPAPFGIRLKAQAGPVRAAWLCCFEALLPQNLPQKRMPATIGDGRLLGGLDLAATLASGKPVAERGLLSEVDGGILTLAMAERLSAGHAARLARVLETGMVVAERDGMALALPSRFSLIALDEGEGDEVPPSALCDRLAITLDLTALSHRDLTPFPYDAAAIAEARARLASVQAGEEVLTALAGTALAFGIGSMRPALDAVLVARALAALNGREVVSEAEAGRAAALVLAPRATRMPALPEAESAEAPQPEPPPDEAEAEVPPPPSEKNASPEENPAPLEDVVLEAALAAMPPGLLLALQAGGAAKAGGAGKAGAMQKAALRGRIIGSKPGEVKGGARLDVIETLRAAAPWQALRRKTSTREGLLIARDDFRIARYKNRAETTTIFLVDASGSSAAQRLAEAKGAVRILLAECYIRRDEVALITFRGTEAALVLPPTRALVRAQRTLAALPGGGGTPIAPALDAALQLAEAVRRAGRTPMLVMMTDGRANIGRGGRPGRAEAQEDARKAATSLRAAGVASLLIDTSPKPQPLAAELASLMGARYVPLPQADAAKVAAAVSTLATPVKARAA